MNPKVDGSVMKVGVKFTENLYQETAKDKNPSKDANYLWKIFDFCKTQTLESLVQDVVKTLQLDHTEEYSLLAIPDNIDVTPPHYLTEENRNEIVNGSVIYIYYSPKRVVDRLFKQFSSATDSVQRLMVLEHLLWHSTDGTFVFEFENRDGFRWLTKGILTSMFNEPELVLAYDMFLKVMEHDIIRWSCIDTAFIDKVASHVCARLDTTAVPAVGSTQVQQRILVFCLSILEAAIYNCAGKFVAEVNRQIPLPNLYSLLKLESQPEVQMNVLALVNAALSCVECDKTKQAMVAFINSRQFREAILQHIVNRHSNTDKNYGNEISHQLYVLQTLMLRALYEDRFASGAPPDEAREKVLEIRNHYVMTNERDAFEQGSGSISSPSISKVSSSGASSMFRSQSSLHSNGSGSSGLDAALAEDFERLGFGGGATTQGAPWEAFQEPMGALVLELLHYFSRSHTDAFVRFVIENSSPIDRQYDCPLVVVSFRLTYLLCNDLLGLGGKSLGATAGVGQEDEGKAFYPMLLTSDRPLEELFSVGLSLLNRTWHEIHATTDDIDIVCDFLREKLYKTMGNPKAVMKFESFHKELAKITYTEIYKHWNEEKVKKEKQKEDSPGIKQLKCLLMQDIKQIVKEQRLNFLIKGTRFEKFTAKGQRVKDKYWYCRLSGNHKTLFYGDCDEEAKNLDETCTSKLNLCEVSQLVVGKDCPHMRDTKGKKSATSLPFALMSNDDSVPNLCFMTSAEQVYNYWVDGLSVLLGQDMPSKDAKKEAEMLLEIDVKLRLLDVEGLSIPDTAPEVPPEPSNLQFALPANSMLIQ